MHEEQQSTAGTASNVSACFQEAMLAVNALREAEKAKKNDEFRTRIALTDLSMTLQRIEQSWDHMTLSKGGQPAAREQLPTTHVDPSVPGDSAPQEQRLAVSSFVATLAERLSQLADRMHEALAAAAKVRDDRVGSNPLGGVLSDANTPQLNASAKTRGPPLVTLVGDDFSSPSASACFSPKGHRRTSFSISDSVSFLPEEAFRPNADDLVSRGTMTQFHVSASASAQTSTCNTASPHNRQSFSGGDSVALWRAYAELLEECCHEDDVVASRRRAMSLLS